MESLAESPFIISFADHKQGLSQFDIQSQDCLTSLTLQTHVSKEGIRKKVNQYFLVELWSWLPSPHCNYGEDLRVRQRPGNL